MTSKEDLEVVEKHLESLAALLKTHTIDPRAALDAAFKLGKRVGYNDAPKSEAERQQMQQLAGLQGQGASGLFPRGQAG
jgi:hypothetical protein